MKSNPHEPPQVPLTESQRREQALLAEATLNAMNSVRDMANSALAEIQLRKWCIEQANAFLQHNESNDDNKPFALDEVAETILKFVGRPFTDIIKEKPAD